MWEGQYSLEIRSVCPVVNVRKGIMLETLAVCLVECSVIRTTSASSMNIVKVLTMLVVEAAYLGKSIITDDLSMSATNVQCIIILISGNMKGVSY